MVRFGHYIHENHIPEWKTHYIGYKLLKKTINQYAARTSNISEEEREEFITTFSKLLDSQIEKIVLFVIEKQGLLAKWLKYLSRRQTDAHCILVTNSEAQTHNELTENGTIIADVEAQSNVKLSEEYRNVGRELLRLLEYVEMNTTGLRKILKKFEKRVGFRLRERYLASRINHPYSQLQQVFRQVGIGALMATISQNLIQLRMETLNRDQRSNSFSLFGRPSLPSKVLEQEPIIKASRALHKLTREATFISFVANSLLIPEPEDQPEELEEKEYHFWSIQLNLCNTFLYMVNYYIVVPTSDLYAEQLHVPPTMNGVIIGAMPLTALVSSLVYSWWSNYSYTAPLIFSTLLLISGNFMYAVALYYNSVWLLIIGRGLSGLGGARAINRRFLVDHVPAKQLTSASAAFVIASSLGMAAGPSLAGILNNLDFKFGGAPVNNVTSPGWLMGFLWITYLILVIVCFKEPSRNSENLQDNSKPADSRDIKAKNVSSDYKLETPLLNKSGEDSTSLLEVVAVEPVEKEKPMQGFLELMKELTLPVRILLTIYFMLKFASEILISESSLVAQLYFDWSSAKAGLFVGGLGLTVLPICALVANNISNKYEDRVIILWSECFVGLGVIGSICYEPIFQYNIFQYMFSAILLFVSANVLEGVNMSLLSKVMSSRLSRGVFNCGFLSTEAGTLARAMADGLITLTGKAGVAYLLNLTMIPTLALVISTIFVTWTGYYSLY
ncbi:hypothetical protein O6H91_07G117600 [Diphasiastrum complanatum]|uniref:Uncharacterized protein n=1 Tax=Diphasiastrum complanatum TaxID=34168 RepID=A0ACC2D947_DIPCM|nr:hypothetical protein O6H91_07G117600 [Diphasiastrum complanatum]